MKSIKLMYLGVLVTLFGLSFGLNGIQFLVIQRFGYEMQLPLSLLSFIIILVGVLIGCVGFFRKN